MHAYIASRYDQFLQDLETLVNVDSGSGHAPGLSRVARFFQERYDRLGWSTRALEFDGGSAPCLEVINRRGLPADPPFDFLFLGHMDTVFPEGTALQRPFSIRDGRAYGPGVCDMKGGLVTMLHAAEAIEQAGLAGALSICMAFNSDEEIGSLLRLAEGREISHEPHGAPAGTVVTVEHLFANVPARLKFLKSAPAEMARVTRRSGLVVLAIANFDSLACRATRAVARRRASLRRRFTAASTGGSASSLLEASSQIAWPCLEIGGTQEGKG